MNINKKNQFNGTQQQLYKRIKKNNKKSVTLLCLNGDIQKTY